MKSSSVSAGRFRRADPHPRSSGKSPRIHTFLPVDNLWISLHDVRSLSIFETLINQEFQHIWIPLRLRNCPVNKPCGFTRRVPSVPVARDPPAQVPHFARLSPPQPHPAAFSTHCPQLAHASAAPPTRFNHPSRVIHRLSTGCQQLSHTLLGVQNLESRLLTGLTPKCTGPYYHYPLSLSPVWKEIPLRRGSALGRSPSQTQPKHHESMKQAWTRCVAMQESPSLIPPRGGHPWSVAPNPPGGALGLAPAAAAPRSGLRVSRIAGACDFRRRSVPAPVPPRGRYFPNKANPWQQVRSPATR